MLVRLMAERDANECTTKMAGTTYKFKRNEYGHLVTEVIDAEVIKFVEHAHNTAFMPYTIPKPKTSIPVTAPPKIVAPVIPPKEPEVVVPAEPEEQEIEEVEEDAPRVPRRESVPKKVQPKKVEPKKKR